MFRAKPSSLFKLATSAPLYRQSLRAFSAPGTDNELHATTVLNVRKGKKVVMIADGQISLGSTVFKNNTRKLRRMNNKDGAVVGFAGSAADAMTLIDLLDKEFEKYPG